MFSVFAFLRARVIPMAELSPHVVLQEVRRDMPVAVPVQIAQLSEEQAANDADTAQIAPPLEVFCPVFLLLGFLCFRGGITRGYLFLQTF